MFCQSVFFITFLNCLLFKQVGYVDFQDLRDVFQGQNGGIVVVSRFYFGNSDVGDLGLVSQFCLRDVSLFSVAANFFREKL